jgi:peptidoglycan/LPS O-acetylase OafA/YrhL
MTSHQAAQSGQADATTPHRVLAYRSDIDGLRAVAVLAVLLFHAFPDLLPGGFWGVDVFFVISGFLISRIIWDGIWSSRFSAREFYGRRIRRIFPALAIVLLTTWIAAYSMLSWDELARVGKHMLSSALFVMNFSLWSEGGYFDVAAERKPLLHLWSLSIEEQFYLIWPLLLCLIGRRKRALGLFLITTGVASFGASVFFNNHNSVGAFYNPLGRAWELVLGSGISYLAIFRPDSLLKIRYAPTLGLLLILGSFAWPGTTSHFNPGIALLPTLGAALVVSAPPNAGLKKWVLQNKLMVWVGLISYPLYLWHWPLLSFALIHHEVEPPIEQRLYLLAISLVLAAITYRCLELPVRKAKHPRSATTALVVAIIVLGALGAFTFRKRGFVQSLALEQAPQFIVDKSMWDKWIVDVRAPGCHIRDEQISFHAPLCTDLTRPRVLLWGDSHAASLYPGLHALQEHRRFGITELTTTGCPPFLDRVTPHPLCSSINKSILATLPQLDPDIIILHAAWIHDRYNWSNTDAQNSLRKILDEIKSKAPRARVIIIGPEIRWEPSLPNVLIKFIEENKQMPPKYLSPPSAWIVSEARNVEEPLRHIAKEKGATYILPRDIICEGERCLTRFGDRQEDLLIFDYGHLTSSGSKFLVSRIEKDIFED